MVVIHFVLIFSVALHNVYEQENNDSKSEGAHKKMRRRKLREENTS